MLEVLWRFARQQLTRYRGYYLVGRW